MLNNFKHFFIIFISAFIVITGFQVLANSNNLVIVYPKNNAKIYANSTFFIGHTHPKATLTINNIPVKVYANGGFVKVFNLKKGNNPVTMKSVLNNDIQIKNITVTVPLISKENNLIKHILKPLDTTLVVTEKEAPVRKTPYGDRLSPAKENMVISAIGYINNHYKIILANNQYAYIGQSSVKETDSAKLSQQILQQVDITEDSKNIVVKIPVKQPVIANIKTANNQLTVKLYGTTLYFQNYIVKSPYVKDFSFKNDTFYISTIATNLNGYDYYYEDNIFILKIRKPFKSGLRGKIIAIDPGHGGKEFGSIGPTEVPEKNINLEISKYLKQELEKQGAKVVMTRDSDFYVDLYERVDIAKNNNADLLISIHNNALPDGQNPYEIHGTTTYYYQPHAIKLAQTIQNNLIKANGFKNMGIKSGSFVLTRPTMPVSVLVEVGFMINPFEYEKLILPKYQKEYATGIAEGIKEYFK